MDGEPSSEEGFATLVTDHYQEMGKAFPVFLRLQQLAKLGGLVQALQAAYETAEEKGWSKVKQELAEVAPSLSRSETAATSQFGGGSGKVVVDERAWVPSLIKVSQAPKRIIIGGVKLTSNLETISGTSRPLSGNGKLLGLDLKRCLLQSLLAFPDL